MPNPAVNPTCAKSRAGRLLRHWASHPEGIREIESGAMLRAYRALLATHVGASTRLQILGLRMVALRTNPRRYLRGYGHGLVSLFLLVAVQATAQVVRIDNSPKRFSVVPPKSWVQQPPSTGNSRVKFSAPSGTPPAECAVIVQEFPALRGKSQQEFDIGMAQPADPNATPAPSRPNLRHPARSDRPAYSPGASFEVGIGMMVQRPITDSFTTVALFEVSSVGGEIKDSPLVDSDYEIEGALGVMYSF